MRVVLTVVFIISFFLSSFLHKHGLIYTHVIFVVWKLATQRHWYVVNYFHKLSMSFYFLNLLCFVYELKTMSNITLAAGHACFFLIQRLLTCDGVMVIVTTYHDKILWNKEDIMMYPIYYQNDPFCASGSSPNVLEFLNNLQITLNLFLGPHRNWSLSNDMIHTSNCMEE